MITLGLCLLVAVVSGFAGFTLGIYLERSLIEVMENRHSSWH